MAGADQIARGQVFPVVTPEEAEAYLATRPIAPETFKMPGSIHDPDMIVHDQGIRLECLKLAVAADVTDGESAVTRARAYAEFVLGEHGGRDA